MKLKKIKPILIVFIIMILLTFVSQSTIYAAINTEYAGEDSVTADGMEDALGDSTILNAIANLVYAVGRLLEWILSTIFTMLTGTSDFPWADKIVFNAVPLLDINFIIPAEYSFVGQENIKIVLQRIYTTIQTIAITFFGIVVLISAVKLVITTIASEKARYKQAVVDWLVGLVTLFCIHYAISFIFYLNEELVEVASEIVTVQLEEAEKKAIKTAEVKNSQFVNQIINNVGNTTYEGTYKGKKNEKISKILQENINILAAWTSLNSEDESRGIHSLLMQDMYVNTNYDENISDYWQYQNLAGIIIWASEENVTLQRLKEIRNSEIPLIKNYAGFHYQGITDDTFNDIFKSAESKELIKNSIGNKFGRQDECLYSFNDVTVYWTASKYCSSEFVSKIHANKPNIFFSDGAPVININSNSTYDTSQTEFHWTNVLEDLIRLKAASDTASGEYKEGSAARSTLIPDLASYYKYATKKREFSSAVGVRDDLDVWGLEKIESIPNMFMYAILVVQSLILFIAYIKRLFYVLILAMIAPIVVAYDFFQKFGK